LKDELVKFIKFNAVGIVNTGVDFGIYTLLVTLGMNFAVAQVISYSCGMLTSYILNSRWTFQDKRDSAGRVVAFILVNVVALLVSIGIQALCIKTFGLSELIAKAVSLPFSIVVNFAGNRLFVFKKES